ncbi:MAG: hypothetical protein DSY58_07745 [Desulfobulbus sp.]|nr:MAG: hypothetical protein DSY58_07745 [Desulfobulbus sp.]
MKYSFYRLVLLAAVIWTGFLPTSAWAIQSHAAPEGLYIHQIGHVLFALAMFGFAWRIRHSRLRSERSWLFMAVGAGLLGVWNGWAFLGHYFCMETPWLMAQFAAHPGLHLLRSLTQMDHLLCVPSLICIYLGLKRMTVEAKEAGSQKAD